MVGEIPNLRVVDNTPNRGYGGALKAGFYASTKEWIAFAPSDNQFVFNQLRDLQAQAGNAGIVTGYRANDADSFMRRVNRWGWNGLVQILFGYMTRDIDCGFKLFRREILQHHTGQRALDRRVEPAACLAAARRGLRAGSPLPGDHRRGGQASLPRAPRR
jgi:glycosyltransferase involved in cell wall biosynthesis